MGLMGEDYVWITTDGITARPDFLTYNSGSYLSYYQGIFGTAPFYGKGNSNYNEMQDAYVVSGGNSADLTMSSVKISFGLNVLQTSLSQLGTCIDRSTLSKIHCSKKNSWADGRTLYNSIQENLLAMEMRDVAGVKRYPAYDIMNFKPNGFERAGFWTYETGIIDSFGQDVSWINRQDLVYSGGKVKAPLGIGSTLRGYHLRIGVLHWPPIALFTDSPYCKKHTTLPSCWEGWNPEIIARLALDLNFTYEYVQPADGLYSRLDKEKQTWGGIFGGLIDRDMDLSIALAITPERSQYIDFTYPFFEDSLVMAMYPNLESTEPSSNMFFFLEPFELSVWGTIVILVIVIAVLTNFFSKFSPFGSYGEKIHAMQTCPCRKCAKRRQYKKLARCRFVDTKKYDCMVEKVEEFDDFNDLSFYNSTWLIGTG